MLLSMLPTYVFATDITVFNVAVKEPEFGEGLSCEASVPETASTYVSKVEWNGELESATISAVTAKADPDTPFASEAPCGKSPTFPARRGMLPLLTGRWKRISPRVHRRPPSHRIIPLQWVGL